ESIWRNKGDPFTVAYRIENESSEYYRFVNELGSMLTKYSKKAKISEVGTVNWESLLGMQGILYEYTIPVSLDELAVNKLGIDEVGFIEKVFLYLEDSTGTKIQLYLIDERNNRCYQMELIGDFSDLLKIYRAFNIEDAGSQLTKYQPSSKASNIKPYIKGNVFLPLTSKREPLYYNVIRLANPIEEYEEYKQLLLDKYTSEFFKKPILKEAEYREDGSVVFTENMKSIVMYRPVGTLEYINLDVSRSDKPMSMLEGYNSAIQFLENTYSISDQIKRNLYLSQIVQSDREYTFYFDLSYEGYRIVLSPEIKTQLGLEHMVQLTIKDGQFIAGKWCIRNLEIMQETVREEDQVLRKFITVGYSEPIDKMYGEILEGESNPLLEKVELVYNLDDLEQPIEMQWGVFFDKVWYYP
ncbi:MAG: hypothetical protein ACRC1P_03565, partial [Cellulosilyticaceae bacterium]